MELTPVAMVVSTATLQCVLFILLDIIKTYDLFQRDHLMAILDEENSV